MSTPSDNLDTLSDEELSATFAVEVVGCGIFCGPTYTGPKFAESADAVLPWLAKCDGWQSLFDQGEMHEYSVDVWAPMHANAHAETFARAACIALILAHRAQKGTP